MYIYIYIYIYIYNVYVYIVKLENYCKLDFLDEMLSLFTLIFVLFPVLCNANEEDYGL